MAGDRPKSDWYPDPEGSGRLRWWDGSAWTDRFKDDGGSSSRQRRVSPLLIGALLAVLLLLAGAAGATVLLDSGSSTEERIAFAGADGESLRTVATDGSDYRRVLAGTQTINSWEISPDGRTAVVELLEETGSRIYLADLEAGERVEISAGIYPRFSSDGSLIAYGRLTGPSEEQTAAYIYDTESGESTRIGRGSPVEFAPDGDAILVTVSGTEANDYRTDVGMLEPGSQPVLVEDGYSPVLAPDGESFAFVRDEGSEESYEPAIFVARVGGSGDVMRVTEGESPVFSPDGRTLAYTREEGEEDSETVLRLIDLETGEDERLSEGFEPVFSPDGSALLFSRSVELSDSYLEELRMIDLESREEFKLAEGEDGVFSEDGEQVTYIDDVGDETWEPIVHVVEVENGVEASLTEGMSPSFYRGAAG